MSIALRPYQTKMKTGIANSWSSGAVNVLAVAPTGAGKCLGKGTPVLMYDGTIRPVEEIQVGDFLMGPDSKPRGVISTCVGREMLYRVTPVKGDSYVVNASHLLSLRPTRGRLVPRNRSEVFKDSPITITAEDFAESTDWFRHIHKGWRTGVDFAPRPTLKALPPYFLGLWLGDGSSRASAITSADYEPVHAMLALGRQEGLQTRVEPAGGRSKTYILTTRIKGKGRGIRHNSVKAALHEAGVLNNKHVPALYKVNDRHTRLEVLAGLLDSDGHLSKGGFQFVSVLRVLAEDVCFLARSLGLAAYLNPVRKTCGNNGVTGDYFSVSISGDCSVVPCRIARKKAPARTQKKSVLVTGLSIEPVGEGDYYGFELAGNDRLFLLGDFTVTHNTVLFASALLEHDGWACAIAHRRELVSQMSTTLARLGVRHRVIAPPSVITEIVRLHIRATSTSYYEANAKIAVASVQTLARRDDLDWAKRVTLWVCDEGHHLLASNLWGKALARFPNARGLGVTATPVRADGKGLGRHADGLMDALIVGPEVRELIDQGYLTDYRIFAPASDINLASVPVSATTGDFNPAALRDAAAKSHITGDLVSNYLRIASGKLGVTFCVSVELAQETAARYRAAGVPAECVSAETPDLIRAQTLERFARREILQLTNVDLFGEGFDLPAIEVVSMGRPTESFALYRQQVGRALRPLEGKDRAIIIDHGGNVLRHGLPDAYREWTLDRRERRSRGTPDDVQMLRACPECTGVYERFRRACPYCGHVPVPASRAAPEFVDGDLLELDPAVLARLRGEANNTFVPIPHGASDIVAKGLQNRARERQAAQQALRSAISWWAGWQKSLGRDDHESYRRFYLAFGVDVATAQTLGRADADALGLKIMEAMAAAGVPTGMERAA